MCEDNLPKKCLIWSEISTMWCDDLGTLEFELYWSKRCDVVIYHFTAYFKGNTCQRKSGATWPDNPQLTLIRNDMWGKKCFNCFYNVLIPPPAGTNIDVLKLQQRGGIVEDFDGVQYTVMSDLHLHHPTLSQNIQQVVMITSITPSTLTDRYDMINNILVSRVLYFNALSSSCTARLSVHPQKILC